VNIGENIILFACWFLIPTACMTSERPEKWVRLLGFFGIWLLPAALVLAGLHISHIFLYPLLLAPVGLVLLIAGIFVMLIEDI
jgi:hypothetical protein